MKVLFVESHNLDYSDPLGSHQYIRLFRKEGHDCYWLGPAISPLHLFKPDHANRHRFRVWLRGGKDVEGISWLLPLTLMPYYDLPLLGSLYAGRNQFRYCVPPVTRQLKKAGLAGVDLIWCAGPVALGLLDRIAHRVSCYRLADRLDQFSRIPKSIGELQREIIRRVDFVIATSSELWEWALEIRQDEVYYLPNGVNDFFFSEETYIPEDFPVNSSGRHVAVFVGTVDSWFDIDTLGYAAESMSDFHFIILGHVRDKYIKGKLDILTKKDNVTYLGGKEHRSVPGYLKRCDVGIIPFHLTPLTHAISPIKYYEYLACGLPVVTSPMRELINLNGPVYFYKNCEDFCLALRNAVNDKKSTGVERGLIDFAREHTWGSRFREIRNIIDRHLEGQEQG